MAIAEKLKQKSGALKEKLSKKSQEAEKDTGAKIDWAEWLLLFLAAGYVGILSIILTVVGLIPYVGQSIYVIANAALDLLATGIFWFYLQYKGLGGYWWLAFGGGLASLIPVADWASWVVAVLILYFLVKAEKVPLASKEKEKAEKAESKIK